MSIEVHPLTSFLGAEVRGVDLAGPLDTGTAEALRRAFAAHRVLLFRGQALSAAQQVAAAEIFGEAEPVRPEDNKPPGTPRILYVANREVEGRPGALPRGAMQLHVDYCFNERPFKALTLFAVQAPESGGDTLMADAQAAYDALPAATKRRLAPLEALHAYQYNDQVTRAATVPPDAPQAVHPVAIRHPVNGRPILFVNRLMTDHIVGLPRAESDDLLAALFDHIEQPQFRLKHRWRAGDFLIWDNLAVLHGREDFDPDAPRVLRRLTLLGQPTAAAPPPVL